MLPWTCEDDCALGRKQVVVVVVECVKERREGTWKGYVQAVHGGCVKQGGSASSI